MLDEKLAAHSLEIQPVFVSGNAGLIASLVEQNAGLALLPDYITKPYNPTILLLRIAAVLKRMEGSQNAASYRGAEVNFSKGTIRLGEKEQVLTKNEMIIFQRLLSSKDKIVSRDEIMTDLWDNEEYVNDNALTVNISRLRTKLAELGLPDAIETRKKQGYRLI